jgi:hypothetical protein
VKGNAVVVFVVCVVAAVVVAGCGGGGGGGSDSAGKHTYLLAARSQNGEGAGIYVTIVSPVAIPTRILTKHGATLVDQVKGPQACSYTKTVHGTDGPGAFLNGKALTLKINGSSPFISMICSLLKKTPFTSANIEGR